MTPRGTVLLYMKLKYLTAVCVSCRLDARSTISIELMNER